MEYLADLPIYCLNGKYIPPGVRVGIQLTQAKDMQRLMADEVAAAANPKLQIEYARLLVTRHLLSPELTLSLHNRWRASSVAYHYVRGVIKGPFTLLNATTQLSIPISNARKPLYVLAFFQDNARYVGAYGRCFRMEIVSGDFH